MMDAFSRALREWNETGDLSLLVEFMQGSGDLPAHQRRAVAGVLEIVRRRSIKRSRGERGKTPIERWSPQKRAAYIAKMHREAWESAFARKMPSDVWSMVIQQSVDAIRNNFNKNIDFDQVKAILDKGHDLSP